MKNNISLTKQITGFYSIHIQQLWYWDNTTRTNSAQQNSADEKKKQKTQKKKKKKSSKKTLQAIFKLAKNSQRGNADLKQRLNNGHEEKFFTRAKR
jgi:dipeptidase